MKTDRGKFIIKIDYDEYIIFGMNDGCKQLGKLIKTRKNVKKL